MYNEDWEEAGVLVVWWTVIKRKLTGVRPAALFIGAAALCKCTTAAPPQSHGAPGAIHTAQREVRGVQGQTGVEGVAGEDGGTARADSRPSLPSFVLATVLTVLHQCPVALRRAAVQQQVVGGNAVSLV